MNIPHTMYTTRSMDGKTIYISLTFYCLRVRYPTKRVLALERYKLRQGKAAIFLTLFAHSEWSNNRNFQRVARVFTTSMITFDINGKQ